jgi:hypothetical protein
MYTKLILHYISATIQAFVLDLSEGLSAAMKLNEVGNKEFSLVLKCERCQLPVKWFYCFQIFYGTRDYENMSSVTSRKDFIMQNCSVKNWLSF